MYPPESESVTTFAPNSVAFSVAYWINGWDLEKSCKYANAAASLKIQKLGARTGMPTETELRTFLKKNNLDY